MSDKVMIFIVGPTASGKTAAAIDIARQVGGEIICADSRTVYRGLDIGTAKPTAKERAAVPHWGLDVVDADEAFSAYRFKQLAEQAIADIRARGKVPIIVGGTGLYVDSLLYDMQLGPPADEAYRAELSAKSIEELQQAIVAEGLHMPVNDRNPRHLIRTLERVGRVGDRRNTPIDGAIVVGITTDREALKARIAARAQLMFDDRRLYEEARLAAATYGWDAPGLTGNIYRLLHALEDGTMTREQATERFCILDSQLAKRQMTWLRRSDDVVWLPRQDVVRFVVEKAQS
jgi:tRNA dimethylallyltransferase